MKYGKYVSSQNSSRGKQRKTRNAETLTIFLNDGSAIYCFVIEPETFLLIVYFV